MKTTVTIGEIRGQTNEELLARAARLKNELFRFRMARQTNQLDNAMGPRVTRRELARVLTVLSGRELGIETRGAILEKED